MVASRANRRAFRFIFMAGGALFDINSPLGGMPAAADRPDPGTQLVSARIDLPQPVAFDAERTVFVASGALSPAGSHLNWVGELEARRMCPREQVIPLMAHLAVVFLMADGTGSPVIQAGVIPMLDFPYRKHVVAWQLAARVFMAEDAGFIGLDPIVAGHTGFHSRKMLGDRRVGSGDSGMAALAGYFLIKMDRVVELGAVVGNALDRQGVFGVAVAFGAIIHVMAFQAGIFLREQVIVAGFAFLGGCMANLAFQAYFLQVITVGENYLRLRSPAALRLCQGQEQHRADK